MDKFKAGREGHRGAINTLVNRTNESNNQELPMIVDSLNKKQKVLQTLNNTILDSTERDSVSRK